MSAPSKFAHIVYRTHRYDEMIDWYVKVFDAKVQNRTDQLAFLTYDEEHHRFAFFNLGPLEGEETPRDPQASGVHHVAYTWDTIDDLLDQYKHMKSLGCAPTFCVRHGPTLSTYFDDPDGNGIEFQVDLVTVDEANDFMLSDAFHQNPIGEVFDPEALIEARAAGKDVTEMVLRSDQDVPTGGIAAS